MSVTAGATSAGALPALRQELTLYRAAPAADGAPSWSLFDPVRNLYFHIDWLTFEILSHWHLGEGERIARAVGSRTTLAADTADVELVATFLRSNELVRVCDAQGSQMLAGLARRRKPGLFSWLLHHYLFFRLPLWRPNAWLARHSPRVEALFSPGFRVLTLAALLLALLALSHQWDTFVVTLVDTFSWRGLLGYAIALVLVKFLHELGHAFTAKRYGCEVPTMGVAFLVMFPMAYTDVNDVWKLTSRRQRLAVGAAGIATELMVAVWATVLWCLLPPGPLRDMLFFLSTTTWISTLIVNASPFMRFDGYFLLMDWLELPNLHQRAFALGRWYLRECLFALRAPPPEHWPPRRERALILFAYLTWGYRLLLFLGIAALVYYAVPKPLGPLLAAVEVVWFIAMPLGRELRQWGVLVKARAPTRRMALSLLVLLAVLAALLLPWDGRIRSQALLSPVEVQPVVAPVGARLVAVPWRDAEPVPASEEIVQLDSPDLHYQLAAVERQLRMARWQYQSAGLDREMQRQQQVTEALVERLLAQRREISDALSRFAPRADHPGLYFTSHPDLQPGAWVAASEVLGELVDSERWKVVTYLTEDQLGRLRRGHRGRFYSEVPGQTVIALRVSSINHDASRLLPEGILASTAGGAIPVRQTEQGLVPEHALYRVQLEPVGDYSPGQVRVLRGHVVMFAEPRSYFDRVFRSVAALFYREAGF